MTPDTFDWESLSQENLKIAQKVIKITLNFLQFQPISNSKLAFATKIPLQKFKNEHLYFDDIKEILNKIDGISVENEKFIYETKKCKEIMARSVIPYDNSTFCLPPEEELKNYVFLEISSLDNLHQIEKLVDKKLDTKIIEFNPLFAPTFDGRSIKEPDIKKLSIFKTAEKIHEKENVDKETTRRIAQKMLDKLNFKEEIKNEVIKEIRNENYNKKNKTDNKSYSDQKIIYWINRAKTREIILNNKYILSKPDFLSENDSVFDTLFEKSKTAKIVKMTKTELESILKVDIGKTLHQVVSDLGFKKELKKIFFPNISTKAIEFTNNLSENDLGNLSISKKQLKSQLKKLKIWKK